MHNKLVKLLCGMEDKGTVIRGASVLSFDLTDREVSEVRIYGSTLFEGGAIRLLGEEDGSDRYRIKMRIHKKNILSGEDFYTYMQKNLSEVEFRRTGDSLTYKSPYETGKYWLAPNEIPFKENTVYTVMFSFTAQRANQSTGIELAYSDGNTEVIFASKAGTYTIRKTSFPHKSLVGLKQRYAGGEVCEIDLSSFGIFEGVIGESEFEEYDGTEYTVTLSKPIMAVEKDGRKICDYVNLFDSSIMQNCGLRNMLFGTSIEIHDATVTPHIFKYTLPQPFDSEYPFYQKSLSVVKDYSELIGKEYACYLGDGGEALYMTGGVADIHPHQLGSYLEDVGSVMVYVKPKKMRKTVYEYSLRPSFPDGYVGIEFISNIPVEKCEFFVKRKETL